MSLKIHYYADPILRKKGLAIKDFDDCLKSLSRDMLDLMYASEGIGLAAQQVGKALQFCVIDVPEHHEHPFFCKLNGRMLSSSLLMPLFMANPTIDPQPSDEYYYEEGCLSFPGINADVARPERIVANYQDLDGVQHSLECDGLLARCIQHEVDHLNGVLFIDRMEKKIFQSLKKEVVELERETARFLRAAPSS